MSSIIAEIFKDEIAEAKAESKEKNLIENIRSLMEMTFNGNDKMDGKTSYGCSHPAKEQEKYFALI